LAIRLRQPFVENVPEGPDSARVIRELAKQGNDIIFTTSFGYMDHTIKVAKEFPNVKFEHITGYKRSPNVATGNIRFYEGRYVQGVVAGLMTKSNKIGYLASFPIPEVIQGINAFGIGLRSVNPKAEVSVIWVNSWYDPVKEADAAKVHIAEGADILAQHTDSPAMLQTAQKAGVHGFGQSSDMKAFAPKAQLFSAVNNWGPYYIQKIQQLWMAHGQPAMALITGLAIHGLACQMIIWCCHHLKTCLPMLPRQQKRPRLM